MLAQGLQDPPGHHPAPRGWFWDGAVSQGAGMGVGQWLWLLCAWLRGVL